jgi:TonB family protein
LLSSRSTLARPIGLGDDVTKGGNTGVLGAINILTQRDHSMGAMGMVLLSLLLHLLLVGLTSLTMFVLQWLGFTVPWFQPPAFKEKDIEFTLVENPEAPPRDKNTKLRSTHNTRSGGQKTPNLQQAETIRAAGTKASSPSPSPQPPAQQPQPKPRPQPQQPQQQAKPVPQPQQQAAPKPVKQTTQAPPPRIPSPKPPKAEAPSAPAPTPPAIRFPKAPSPSPVPKPMALGPVSSNYGAQSGNPGGSRSGSSVGPSQLPGSFSGGGRSGRGTPGSLSGSGGRGSYDQSGSSGGGGGRPGVDAIAAPDYGAYMAELQRRIKRNWRPPTAQEDKRVVVQFNIGRDGRLLSLGLAKSSGYPEADAAALNAVRLSAPFRSLPPGHRENDLPIQFTFDYNVFRSGGFSLR